MKSLIAAAVLMAFPISARAEVDKKAERMWKAKCATCHGADGKGQTDTGTSMGITDMSSAAWQKTFSDTTMKDAITKGVSRTKDGKKQQMDPFDLEPAQVDSLVAYIRTLKK